jgi:7,8-dihydropterin-6-yl-methyl-4-(beta-D-ribofuranosyl)aminobenzene 5'-phosphate synthase
MSIGEAVTVKIICVLNDNIPENSGLHCEHGLSFWVENDQNVLLFDTGQTDSVLSYNLDMLGLSIDAVDKIALSHAHDDHTGGLDLFFNRPKKILLYANQDFFTRRFSYRKKEYREIGCQYNKATLSKHFFLHLQDIPVELLPNLWTTGKITTRPEKMGGSEHHFIKPANEWLPDPYLDDMSLVLKTENGLVLICGCCHAGLLNTLKHAEEVFQHKVTTVIGGAHLVSFDENDLDHVIEVIQNKYPDCQFMLNHCTGAKAIQVLQENLDNKVEEFLPGTWLEF